MNQFLNKNLIPKMNSEIFSGILTGIISTIIFNPIDKAIYMSTTKNISITCI